MMKLDKPTATMDLGLLRTFLAVLDLGGFTAAARTLHKTQSTVSLHIQRLEKLVGQPLFERTTRKVKLTEQGEVLLVYAQDLIRINDEALLRFDRPAISGTIRIGILEDFATDLLPEALRRFNDAYPAIGLRVQSALTSELQHELNNDNLDLIIVRHNDHSIPGEVLWREPLQWIGASHRQFTTGPIPLVMFPSECVYRAEVLERIRSSSRKWEIVYTSTSLSGVQAAVTAGVGVSVLAQSEVLPEYSVLGEAEQLPELPGTEVVMRLGHRCGDEASVLGEYLAAAVPSLGASTSRLNAIRRDRCGLVRKRPPPDVSVQMPSHTIINSGK